MQLASAEYAARRAANGSESFLHDQIVELITHGSIECTLRDAPAIARSAELLPRGMAVYVTALPHQSLDDTLAGLRLIRRAGLQPVPHIAARRVPARAALKEFTERAVLECEVDRVLVIAGDDGIVRGPYRDSEALLADDVLVNAGIREVGVAGYPEGHAEISSDALQTSFDRKRAIARSQGLGLYVLTQFSFAPARVLEFSAALTRSAREVPVYVGMAGPAHGESLRRFAQRCGVSAPLRALQDMGFGATSAFARTDPTDQLRTLARYCAARRDCNVVGAHFFSFGAFARTARWLHATVLARHLAQPFATV